MQMPEGFSSGSAEGAIVQREGLSRTMEIFKSTELLDRAKREVHRSVISLRDEEKVAYLEACALVPDLIEQESNPAWFLRREKCDVLAASARLARYWTERKSIFGDRAFLPMDCCGQGALSAEDIRVLSCGVLHVLPNDNHGRVVLLIDFDAFSSNKSVVDIKTTRTRLLFYILAKMARDRPNVLIDGFVCIRVFRSLKFNRDNLKMFLRFHEVAMPMQLQLFHICCLSKPEVRKYFVDTVAPIVAASSAKHAALLKVHVARTKPEMLEKLEVYGLLENGLPPCLGGSYSAEDAKQKASAAASAPEVGNEVEDIHGGRQDETEIESGSHDAVVEERKARKRKNDVVYARQRRMREKVDQDSLKSQHLELRSKNAKLWRENKKLEQLFTEATAMVSTLGPSPKATVGATMSPPSQVEIALRALATLRQSKNCSVRDLLVNPNVRDCISGVVDKDQVFSPLDSPNLSLPSVASRLPPASVANIPLQQRMASASNLSESSGGGMMSQYIDPSPPSDLVKNLTASLYRDLQEAEYKTAMLQRLSQNEFECSTTAVQTNVADRLRDCLARPKDASIATERSVESVQNPLFTGWQAPLRASSPPKVPIAGLRLGGQPFVQGQNSLRDALVTKILQKLSAAQRPRGM